MRKKKPSTIVHNLTTSHFVFISSKVKRFNMDEKKSSNSIIRWVNHNSVSNSARRFICFFFFGILSFHLKYCASLISIAYISKSRYTIDCECVFVTNYETYRLKGAKESYRAQRNDPSFQGDFDLLKRIFFFLVKNGVWRRAIKSD